MARSMNQAHEIPRWPGDSVENLTGVSESLLRTTEGPGGLDISVTPTGLLSVVRQLSTAPGLAPVWLSDLGATPKERGCLDGDLELVYCVRSLVVAGTARIRVEIASPKRTVSSVTHRWPSAEGLEKELSQIHGVHFRPMGHRRRVAPVEFSSMWEQESSKRGDPAADGRWRLLEFRTYEQIVPLLQGSRTAFNLQACYCRAVESLLGWSVPPRATWMRMMACEWERMAGHADVLAAWSLRIGASTAAASLLLARDEIDRLRNRHLACRFGGSLLRIGGLLEEPEHFRPSDIRDCLRWLPDLWNDAHDILRGSMAMEERLRGREILPGILALEQGITGPLIRASGVALDLRAKEPYEFYGELPLRVCTKTEGDAWDRILIRFDEISASMTLIEQCLERMEEGPVLAEEARRGRRPADSTLPISREQLDAVLIRVRDGIGVPAGEAFAHTESLHGEVTVRVRSDGERTPLCVHVRSPLQRNREGLARMGFPQASFDPDIRAEVFDLNRCGADL